MDAFWAKVAALLAKKIEAAVRPTGAPFVREALVNQLPRVMGTLQGSLQKVRLFSLYLTTFWFFFV